MGREERAAALFNEGYNCAQAVVLAFSDLFEEDEQTLATAVSGFGGGFSRMREVCGAVSGMTYVLSRLFGYSNPKDTDAKMHTYDIVRSACQKFEAQFGSIVCREMLKDVGIVDGDRTGRPCSRAVAFAAKLVEDRLQTQNEQ
jgi:C_GCAxxG_C_C family probable redox protein